MLTVSVAELRQNPSPVLAEVRRGRTYVVTRHREAIARLTPVDQAWPTGEQLTQFGDKRRREHSQDASGFTPAWLREQRETVAADDPWERR